MRFLKVEKIILSFLIAAVLILNIVSPIAAAVIKSNYNGERLPTCNLFCNLSLMDDKAKKDIPCPHHAKEAKKKRLNELFQCRISQSPCHDTAATQQAGTQVDPYLLSDYAFDDNLGILSLYSVKLNIPFQIYDFSLEKPPTILS
ncbi:MAG: hypothetical protein HZC10_07925 [Nitrospirae bacterium]|nr:hypothetical protein [Nitrospirota bacterium]